MIRPLPLLLAAALLAPAAPAAAQSRDTSSRPHSVAKTRARDNVLVDRLEATVRRSRGLLTVRVEVHAVSTDNATHRAVIRGGRCTTGAVTFPSCPPTFSRAINVGPGGLTGRFTFPLREPSRRLDAIRITVNRPGEVTSPRPGGASAAHAQLYLRGSAWRALAGDRFGLTISNDEDFRVTRATADATGLSPSQARPTLAWTAQSTQGVDVETVAAACDGDDCTSRSFFTTLTGGQASSFQRRPVLRRAGAERLTYLLRRNGQTRDLFRIALPWPG